MLGLYDDATEAFIKENCLDADGNVDEVAAEEERQYRKEQIKACSRWSRAWSFAYECYLDNEFEHPIDVFQQFGGIHGCIVEEKHRATNNNTIDEESEEAPTPPLDIENPSEETSSVSAAQLETTTTESISEFAGPVLQCAEADPRFMPLIEEAMKHPVSQPFKAESKLAVKKPELRFLLVQVEEDGETVTPLQFFQMEDHIFQTVLTHHIDQTKAN